MPIQGAFVGQDEKTQRKVREQSRAIQAQRLADAQAGKMALAQTEQAGAMARTNTTGQFDLARQKLAGENALATTGMHVSGQKDITGMQGANQLAVQKLVGENSLATTGLQNAGAMERTQATEAGATQRGRETLAGNILTGGGTGAQQLLNTPTWASPDVSGVTMPQKEKTGIYAATKDGEGNTTIYNTQTGRDPEGNIIRGPQAQTAIQRLAAVPLSPVPGKSLMGAITGANATNEINTHLQNYDALPDDETRLQYLANMKKKNPAMYTQVRNSYKQRQASSQANAQASLL